MKKYSIIDTETTGLKASTNKIIEIAIINMDGNTETDRYETLINPCIPINYRISQITGLSNSDLKNAPSFKSVARKIVEMTKNRIFVAHNARFDFDFIRHEYARLAYDYNLERLCTVQLARKAFPGAPSYSLSKICNTLDIQHKIKHRAMGDAEVTATLFQKILFNLKSSPISPTKAGKALPRSA